MADKEEWNEVEVPETENKEEKVQYEIEGEQQEEVQASKEPEVKKKEPEVKKKEPEVQEENPEELKGIETEGAQKRIRYLIRQRKERDEQIQNLIRTNETLKNQSTAERNNFNKVSKLNLEATEKQLNDKVDLARNSYLEAFESQDKERLLKSQESLNEAQADLKNLHITKQQFPDETQQPVQPQVAPQQQMQATPDPRAQDWAEQNEWFGKDNIMTASALAIDAELKNEGYTPEDPDFYNQVNKRITAAFPHKFKTETVAEEPVRTDGPSTPSQVVSGSSRSSPNSKKVKLSQGDIRLANKWSIPLEQYAAEKLKTEKAEGEYTTINMKRGG
tara:strand:- start:955 stop:1953 length:999 start_codon:yes stop_codon:yes gene_type:complete